MALDKYLALRPNLKTREDYRNSFITNSVLADTIIEGLINDVSTRRLKHFQNTPSSPVNPPTNSSQSDSLQVKSHILVKQTD